MRIVANNQIVVENVVVELSAADVQKLQKCKQGFRMLPDPTKQDLEPVLQLVTAILDTVRP